MRPDTFTFMISFQYQTREDIKMQQNLTEIVFILDRSGSMGGLEDDTIGGFNAMIEKQKREPQPQPQKK